jgi:hypothetical protein
MSRRPSTFKATDLTRAIKAAKAAGMEPRRVTITPTGAIEIRFGEDEDQDANPWDEVLNHEDH